MLRAGIETDSGYARLMLSQAQHRNTVWLVQVIDEGSTDGTVERLEEAGVAVLRASEPHGLTQSWNTVRPRRPCADWSLIALRCACVLCAMNDLIAMSV